ncbi:xylulokinase [Labedaea rhizosphaerae]|uniref:Xylulose kinase n=1 Tax=Labedaea rhizosphaerae TaxID=598644 RepID=A0A4R6RVQ1_LABRH|nr:xylulokinase [Labedaea rhizosphaerae]TDP91071.1 xylulokinase [Labedaea rhizosphaerae]
MSTLVAGIDSSTQSCKLVVRDAHSGVVVRSATRPHPDGTEVDPEAWWSAMTAVIADVGGLDDVAALSIAAQQHGMVCLDESGAVVRDALLWNDTRSAGAAAELVVEDGPAAWVRAVGSVPVASFTVTKLRWLANHEPRNAARTAAVALPHDWLTWRLAGGRSIDQLTTDRSDASGTGYFSAAEGEYRRDLFVRALGHDAVLPTVLAPHEPAGKTGKTVLGPGAGDNAAAALGVGAQPDDVVVSIGTSGTAFAVAARPTADASGSVAGFADATGRFLPLVCTLNAARVFDATAAMLGVSHERFSELALSAPSGCDGLVLVPYLDGERTPDLPKATGALHGMTMRTASPAHLARAAVEGVLCGLADAVDAILAHGARCRRVLLIGGGARSAAVRAIAPTVFGRPVVVPEPDEYVAGGAARQAAWVQLGGDEPPRWAGAGSTVHEADPVPAVRERYALARQRLLDRR